MSVRKKKFMMAGSVGSLIEAGIFSLIMIALICILHLITEANIGNLLEATGLFTQSTANGEIVYSYLKANGTTIVLASADIAGFAGWLKSTLISSIASTLVLSIATIVINIFVIKHAKSGTNKKWAIISSLVLDVLMFNMVSMAFMITSLALIQKNKVILDK